MTSTWLREFSHRRCSGRQPPSGDPVLPCSDRKARNGMNKSGLSGIFRIAVEQFNRNPLRSPQKADLDAGARGVRFLGELDAFFLRSAAMASMPETARPK